MIGRTYRFETVLDLQMIGTYRYHAVRVPKETQVEIVFRRGVKHRVEGEIGGRPYAGALLPTGTGGYYLMVNEKLRKAAGLVLGSPVSVTFTIVDPELVRVPDDVRERLERDPELGAKWDLLSAGNRRGLVHGVESAATEATRSRRIEELMDGLARSVPFDRPSRRTSC